MMKLSILLYVVFFFFNDTATTEIYTLSLHDALPISFVVAYYLDRIRFMHSFIRALYFLPFLTTAAAMAWVWRWFYQPVPIGDRKSTRLNSSHANISYAVFCLKKKKNINMITYSHIHI